MQNSLCIYLIQIKSVRLYGSGCGLMGSCAEGSGDLEIVKELISLGCSPLEADHIGWTPVMWAAAGGHAPVIQELMRLGADIRVMDNQSRWPLHWAAEKGHVEAVDLLVKHLSDAHADLHLQVLTLQLCRHPVLVNICGSQHTTHTSKQFLFAYDIHILMVGGMC